METVSPSRKPGTAALLALCITAGIAARVLVAVMNRDIVLPEELGEAGWEKISVSLNWIMDPFFPLLTIYGPLHTYLISLFWLVSKAHVVLLSRLATLGFSLAALPVFHAAVKEVTGSGRIAAIALFFACIYPADVLCSSVPVPESIAFFMLFGAIWALARHMRHGGAGSFLLSAACVNLAGMLRYELWPCGFFLAVWLYRNSRGPRRLAPALAYAAAASVFIFYWMNRSLNIADTGNNPLGSFNEAADLTSALLAAAPALRLARDFAVESAKALSLPLLALCAAGLVYGAGPKRRDIFWFMASFYTLNLLAQPLLKIYHPANLRHICLAGYLALPGAAAATDAGLRRLPAALRKGAPRVLLGLALAAALTLSGAGVIRKSLHNMRHVVPADIKETSAWLREHLAPNLKSGLILELEGFNFYLMSNSGLHPRQYTYYDPSPGPRGTPDDELDAMLSDSSHMLISEENKLYGKLIRNDYGPRFSFTELIRIGQWTVYEIRENRKAAPKTARVRDKTNPRSNRTKKGPAKP